MTLILSTGFELVGALSPVNHKGLSGAENKLQVVSKLHRTQVTKPRQFSGECRLGVKYVRSIQPQRSSRGEICLVNSAERPSWGEMSGQFNRKNRLRAK